MKQQRQFRRWLLCLAIEVGLGAMCACRFANTADVPPASTTETDKFIPSRILWVDQNDPKAADNGDNDYHKVIGRCEQVFVDGYLLLQVLDRSQLCRGTFYVDLEKQRLYICSTSNIDLKGITRPLEPACWSMICG